MNFPRKLFSLCFAACLSVSTFAQSVHLETGLSGQYDLNSRFSTEELLSTGFTSDNLDLAMKLRMNNDRRFGSDTIYLNTGTDLGNYLLVDRGDVTLKGLGMALQVGRFLPKDEVDSPYSLVLNPNALSQNGMKFSYHVGPFTYSSEWISLSYQSKFSSTAETPPAWQYTWNGSAWVRNGTGFPDRGADVHNFVFESGSWRVGIQDQSIYSGRHFDSEYFFSPMPQYFTEYLRTMGGRPWTAAGELDKYMMGFFTQWKEGDRDAFVQFQLADFNLHFLNESLFPNNPAKFAWSVGGHWANDWGRWGVFHAGATKYMYEAMTVGPGSESVRDVGNFYYPDTVYNLNGSFVPIDLQSSQIGYTNGENNLAFQATWDNTFAENRLHLGASLEYVVAGANSPANPWQGSQTATSTLGTQLLNDPVLAQTIQSVLSAETAVGAWTISAHLTLGEAFHVLQLTNPPNYTADPTTPQSSLSTLVSMIKIWVPSDQNQAIFRFVLGAKYSYDSGMITGW